MKAIIRLLLILSSLFSNLNAQDFKIQGRLSSSQWLDINNFAADKSVRDFGQIRANVNFAPRPSLEFRLVRLTNTTLINPDVTITPILGNPNAFLVPGRNDIGASNLHPTIPKVFQIRFAPDARAFFEAEVTITYQNGSSSSLRICGEGIGERRLTVNRTISPLTTGSPISQGSTQTFPNANLNAGQNPIVYFRNYSSGNLPLTVTSANISGGNGAFQVVNFQPLGIYSIRFAPPAAGTYTATFTVNSNTEGGFQSCTLRGTATGVARPIVTFLSSTSPSGPFSDGLNPGSFGTLPNGTTSATRYFRVRNDGIANLSFSFSQVTGDTANFSATSTSGSLAPGAEGLPFSVTFTPNANRSFLANVRFNTNTSTGFTDLRVSGSLPADPNTLNVEAFNRGTNSWQRLTSNQAAISRTTILRARQGTASNFASLRVTNDTGSTIQNLQVNNAGDPFINSNPVITNLAPGQTWPGSFSINTETAGTFNRTILITFGPSGATSFFRVNIQGEVVPEPPRPLPEIISSSLNGTDLTVTYQSIAGESFVAYFSDDLENWVHIGNLLSGDGSVQTTTFPFFVDPMLPSRFYRISRGPTPIDFD